ncbi:MAG: hypothetical protein ABIF85_06145 [Nanoarchaeota archaeon]
MIESAILSKEQIKKLVPPMVAQVSEIKKVPGKATKYIQKEMFKIPAFCTKYNIKIAQTKTESDRTIYVLETCVFNPDHTGSKEACIVQTMSGQNTGKIGYKCHHESCKDKHWRDVRNLFEPDMESKTLKSEEIILQNGSILTVTKDSAETTYNGLRIEINDIRFEDNCKCLFRIIENETVKTAPTISLKNETSFTKNLTSISNFLKTKKEDVSAFILSIGDALDKVHTERKNAQEQELDLDDTTEPDPLYFAMDNIYGITGIIENVPNHGLCIKNNMTGNRIFNLLNQFSNMQKLDIESRTLSKIAYDFAKKEPSERLSPFWVTGFTEYHDPFSGEKFYELIFQDQHARKYTFLDSPDKLIEKMKINLFAKSKLEEVLIFLPDELRKKEYIEKGISKYVERPAACGFFIEKDKLIFYPPILMDYSTLFSEFEMNLRETITQDELKEALIVLDTYITKAKNPQKMKIILFYIIVSPLSFARIMSGRQRFYELSYGKKNAAKTQTLEYQSRFIWGLKMKMKTAETYKSSYQMARALSTTTFGILIDECETLFEEDWIIDLLKAAGTSDVQRTRKDSQHNYYATPIFTANKNVIEKEDDATRRRFIAIQFSEKDVPTPEEIKIFQEKILPDLLKCSGVIGANIKEFFLNQWNDISKSVLGTKEEFLSVGRTALLNSYQTASMDAPKWLSEDFTLTDTEEERDSIELLAWKVIMNDVSEKCRSHRMAFNDDDLPNMNSTPPALSDQTLKTKIVNLILLNDLPNYIFSRVDRSTKKRKIYITRGIYKRIEKEFAVKTDDTFEDLAKKMGIEHNRTTALTEKKIAAMSCTIPEFIEKCETAFNEICESPKAEPQGK